MPGGSCYEQISMWQKKHVVMLARPEGEAHSAATVSRAELQLDASSVSAAFIYILFYIKHPSALQHQTNCFMQSKVGSHGIC